jgi:hypothetical protein
MGVLDLKIMGVLDLKIMGVLDLKIMGVLDLKIMGVLDLKKRVLARKKWQELLEQAKPHPGLYRVKRRKLQISFSKCCVEK